MPPRIRLQPRLLRGRGPGLSPQQRRWASTPAAQATTPAPPVEQTTRAVPPIQRYPPTQPPSHRRPEFRKSQLLRQYISLLKSSPLIIFFQHNNLRAVEWMGVRRELAAALRKIDAETVEAGRSLPYPNYAAGIKLQVVQTGMLATAVRLVEFYDPATGAGPSLTHPTDPQTQSSAPVADTLATPDDERLSHYLSRHAHHVALHRSQRAKHGLEPLLSGPLALLTFPDVAPEHLATALKILSPSPSFPAPKRRQSPGLYDQRVQAGLSNLMMLGARVEGRIFDGDGVRWVGGIQGGMDGLRSQLVATLQGAGSSLARTLGAAGTSLWWTMESRRDVLKKEESASSTDIPKEE
ncbi:hypothetical protein BDY21DRAFT_359309 [Lineolata rhizophorae]|uniref:Uncharacterized protein n=1 Tax=Lineolata rhizophorae TaxID=578093 RepID=A0A6A6NLL5_9PEZI|nr:hypothetical protein BDY21DRAFT_359309 [Lineolata rhizophorae]